MISKEGKKRIMIAAVFIILGLIIGFYAGSYIVIKSIAKIGSGFIDYRLVEQAVFLYENNIASCFPSTINLQ